MDFDSCNPCQCTRLAAATGFQEQEFAQKQTILLRAQIASGRPVILYQATRLSEDRWPQRVSDYPRNLIDCSLKV